MKIFSIRAVLKESYGIIKPKFWKVVGQYALICCIFIGMNLCAGNNFLISTILSAFLSFVSVVFGFSYVEMGSFSFEDVFKNLTFKKFVLFFLGSLLADLAIFGGFILLVIPAIYILVLLRFAKYILVKEDIMPLPALKKSIRLTKGSRTKIFELMVVSLIINLLGLIVVGVGLFFTVPLTLIAFVIIYKKLSVSTVLSEEG